MITTASSGFAGLPIPTLQSIDTMGKVIYLNTFSKTLTPSVRISYMVLPEHLLKLYRKKLGFYACTVGALEQLTLARFMESGDYERHVNRQRTRYRRRLSALIDALAASSAGDHLHFANAGAGLHFLMEVRGVEGDERDSATFEERVARRAAIRGVRLAPLGRYRFTGCEAGAPGAQLERNGRLPVRGSRSRGCPKGMRRGAVWVQRGEGSAPSRLRDELLFLGRRDDPGGSRDRLGGGCGRAGLTWSSSMN